MLGESEEEEEEYGKQGLRETGTESEEMSRCLKTDGQTETTEVQAPEWIEQER